MFYCYPFIHPFTVFWSLSSTHSVFICSSLSHHSFLSLTQSCLSAGIMLPLCFLPTVVSRRGKENYSTCLSKTLSFVLVSLSATGLWGRLVRCFTWKIVPFKSTIHPKFLFCYHLTLMMFQTSMTFFLKHKILLISL